MNINIKIFKYRFSFEDNFLKLFNIIKYKLTNQLIKELSILFFNHNINKNNYDENKKIEKL